MSVWNFRPEPTGQGMTTQDFWNSAFAQPLPISSTLSGTTAGAFSQTFGLGSAIRTQSLPGEAEAPRLVYTSKTGDRFNVIDIPLYRRMFERRVQSEGGVLRTETPEELAFRAPPAAGAPVAITEEEYKDSASFREKVPWDPGMTKERAAALADQYDLQQVRDFYAAKRPFTAFAGQFLGAAGDPINYIPIFGEVTTAAAVAKMGKVVGRAAVASADAATNTALFAAATASERSKLGDDVSFQATMMQVGMAALVGAAFGGIHGVFGRDPNLMLKARENLSTLARTQESLITLNDAVQTFSADGEVKLGESSRAIIEHTAVEQRRVVDEAYVAEASQRFRESLVVGGETSQSALDYGTRVFEENMRRNLAEIPAGRATDDYRQSSARVNIVERPEGWMGEPRHFDVVNFEGVIEDSFPTRAEAQASIDPLTAKEIAALPEAERPAAQARAAVERNARTAAYQEGNWKFYTWGEADIKNIEFNEPVHEKDNVQKAFTLDGRVFVATSHGAAMEKAAKVFGQARVNRAVENDAERHLGWAVKQEGPVAQPQPRQLDMSLAQQEPLPAGLPEAEAKVGKPEELKQFAENAQVDPETGAYPEQAEVDQLRAEKRLLPGSPEQKTIDVADETYRDANAWAKALEYAVGCVI